MLEMILVIVVISLITLFAVQRSTRYTISANVQTINGSKKMLFDLIDRYYNVSCANLTRTSGHTVTLSESDFVNANIISSDSYQAAVHAPFGQSTDAYLASMTYQPKSGSVYWTAEVTYEFPNATPSQTVSMYASKLNPTEIRGTATLVWRQAVGTRTQNAGVILSPQAEDLKRFSIQQYVPTSDTVGQGAQNRAYSSDYTSAYRPSSTDSCEAIEEMALTGTDFQQKRSVR